MRIEYTVPGFVKYHTMEALADSTGLPWEVVQDHLQGYLEATIDMTLRELRISADEQERFASYVMAERKAKATLTRRRKRSPQPSRSEGRAPIIP